MVNNKRLIKNIKNGLNNGEFIIEECENETKALEKIQDEEVKIAIIKQRFLPINSFKFLKILRKVKRNSYLYVIIYALNNKNENILEILKSGADDYILKPLKMDDLCSKIENGKKFIKLYEYMNEEIRLKDISRNNDKTFKKILPICSYCKSIKLEQDSWQKLEDFIFFISGLKLTHGVCPECFEKHLKVKISKAKIDKIC